MKRSSMAVALACVVFLGCGEAAPDDEPDRAVVSGKVTYAGQPVADGEIRFVPAEGTQAPVSTALIVDGAYSVNHKGGAPLGTHRIEVLAYRAKAGESEEIPGATEGSAAKEQFIPEKHNAKSKLEITVSTAGEAIVKDVELEE